MLRKYAMTEILSATLAPTGQAALARYAHRHAFTYEPRPGYLYVRSRAISSRTNDNFDTFPPEEIKASYASFVGKPVFINHNNDNHRRARGVCIDAALHEDRNPDGSPDTWAEVLMEVDAVRFPKLAKAILAGHIDRTSMGTDVAYSLCSFCGNKATTPLEYCAHIPKMKGKRIYRTTASGTKEGVLVSEICHGLKFFENSLLVEEPADPTAFFLGVEGHGVKTASKVVAHETGSDHIHLSDAARQEMADASNAGKNYADMQAHYQKTPANTSDHHDLLSHMLTAHEGHGSLQHYSHEELQEEHDSEHHEYAEDWPNAVNMDGHHFHEARRRTAAQVYGGPPEGATHDGHTVRLYPLSGSSGFITGHKAECDGCRDGYTQGAARHWTPPGTKCENPNHDSNMGKIQSGDKGGDYSEYEQFSHDPAVAGWDTHKGVACQDCAANMKPNSDRHHEWSAIPKHLVSPQDDCATCGKSLIHAALASLTPRMAYGEQMAPADVDTLRDEECPVCAEADAYDGNECQVCGFIAPPKMFMDPDLDVAKQQDLRGDMQQEMLSDPNGDGMPDVIPGSGNPGTDAPPMDPEQVPDPDDVAQQQVNEIVDGQEPLQPEQLDENGQPVVDPDPMMQEMPADPAAAQMQEQDVAGSEPGMGDPGTPADGVADLACPACGFETDATPPQSTDMDTPTADLGEVAEGALCPQCGQGQLVSLKQVDETINQGIHASLFPVIRL